MSGTVWTPVAESDLDDILFYISLVDRRPETGERIYYEIRDRVAEHAAKKLPGQQHPHAPEGWLYLRHKRWLIFCQPHPKGIEILRVGRGSRLAKSTSIRAVDQRRILTPTYRRIVPHLT